MTTQNKLPKIYSARCDFCLKEFSALSQTQVLSQLAVHQNFCQIMKKAKQEEEEKDEL